MEQPTEPPGPTNLDAWRAYALSYLSQELREAVPRELGEATFFPRSPLEGEGATVIFSFQADRDGGGSTAYYVVIGETQPNYYPAQGLDADEAFSLHLGTRFMLVMGAAQATSAAADDYDAYGDARAMADHVAPDKPLEDVRVEATFDVEGQFHSVLSCSPAGQRVYLMGRDAPSGFSRRVDLSPHVVYRLHIGQVLRREPELGKE